MSDLIVRSASAPLTGAPELVGDKSISHRALMLAALSEGTTSLANLSTSTDVAATRRCLRELGVHVVEDGEASSGQVGSGGDRPPDGEVPGGATVIFGRGLSGLAGPAVTLDCGDSGTTMRLLAGLLAGQDREFTLAAGPSLARRPMARVVEPLAAMGAKLAANGPQGLPPIRGRGGKLRGIHFDLPQASAQVASAVLFAGLRAAGETSVTYPAPVRDHTERMLAAMGVPIAWDGGTTRLAGPVRRLARLGGGHTVIPNDPSAAAFAAAAAGVCPGSLVVLTGLCLNPGRRGFIEVLRRMGTAITEANWRTAGGEPVADITVEFRPLRAVEVDRREVPSTIDELPLVAVVATQAHGRTEVRGAAELRVKESDRITAVAEGLRRMGAHIETMTDGFAVTGPTPLRGAEVSGYGDHRIVMALTIAGLAAVGESRVSGAECVADSYPGFVGDLCRCGASLEVA